MIDVPGDGDCFYHSVLKVKDISDQFSSVKTLQLHLTRSVLSSYDNDPYLKKMFQYERLEVNSWYLLHSKMGQWATHFERLLFSYLLIYEVYTVGNYMCGFYCSSSTY